MAEYERETIGCMRTFPILVSVGAVRALSKEKSERIYKISEHPGGKLPKRLCGKIGCCLNKNMNASRPSENPTVRGKMSKRLGRIVGCKDKTTSWHINGFPDGSNIESTV